MNDWGLLERDSELAAVEGLIADASAGGRLLAIERPPGIGKTALLVQARSLAPAVRNGYGR